MRSEGRVGPYANFVKKGRETWLSIPCGPSLVAITLQDKLPKCREDVLDCAVLRMLSQMHLYPSQITQFGYLSWQQKAGEESVEFHSLLSY